MEAWAVLPDQQKKWLILINNWDIDRQAVYRYRNPVLLPKGSVLHMRFVYDNSADNTHNPHVPPVRVRAGNRSEDEMAHLWLQVLPVNTRMGGPDPRLLLEEAWMRNWLRKDPKDLVPLYNLASALAGQGNFEEAIVTYRQALVFHPGDERIMNELGAAFENSGDWQQAQKVFAQNIALHPDTCYARFNLATSDLKHDQANAAEQQFRAMLTRCADDAPIHSGLGAALEMQGQEEPAEVAFRAALGMNPDDFTALFDLGDLALRAGQPQRPAEFLASAVRQRPQDADAREHLAEAYAMSGRMDDATTQLREAIRLAPSDPDPHSLLSQALASNGQPLEAIAERKTALHLRPNDADEWNDLGVLEATAASLPKRGTISAVPYSGARSCPSASELAASSAIAFTHVLGIHPVKKKAKSTPKNGASFVGRTPHPKAVGFESCNHNSPRMHMHRLTQRAESNRCMQVRCVWTILALRREIASQISRFPEIVNGPSCSFCQGL
jgi:Flp pilus assembly protein TadD